MGFLDNLESNLKNLEERDQREDPRSREDREAARRKALAAAPFAEELKKGAFTRDLLSHATRIGFSRRLKVRMTWLGDTLRLEAGERRLDLEPTPEGIQAGFFEGARALRARRLQPGESAEALAREWLEAA